MSLVLGDCMRYERGELSRDEVAEIVSQNPTSLEILQKQLENLEPRFADFVSAIKNKERPGDIDYQATLLSKIDIMLLEPNITPEMRKILEDMQSFIFSQEKKVKTILKTIARKVTTTMTMEDEEY